MIRARGGERSRIAPATCISAPSLRQVRHEPPRKGFLMATVQGRTGLRAARRRRRDRHEPRALRLRPGATAANGSPSIGRRLRPRRSCRASTWCFPTSASSRSASPTSGHRDHPRARGSLRRAARFLAAAQGAGADDAVRRRSAGGQAAVRAGRAASPGDHRTGPARSFRVGPFDVEYDPGLPLDPRADVARHPHAARHRHPYRRLEARSRPGTWAADRRAAVPRARRGGRAGADLRFHQRHARRRQPEREARSAPACRS